jgi:serine/threonine-protein kinase
MVSSEERAGTPHLTPSAAAFPRAPVYAILGPVKLCPTCRRDFDGEQQFCPYDGGALVDPDAPAAPRPWCPRCQREYEADHRFCTIDGERLSDEPRRAGVRTTNKMDTVLGERYLIRGFIGKGATARVYLAEDLERGEPVAVKVLDEAFAKARGSRERFLREASAAAKIRHPNVVEIYNTGRREDGIPYLIMEFMFGESLGDLLRREQRMTTGEALVVLRQAARGLDAAHQAGVIHRDVKPDNIFLVGEPGSSYAVKVLDFGLARIKELPSVTGLGIAVGTMEYMAPEQVVTEATDPRTDVYGLGVVMYRTFAGRLPFETSDDVKLLASQLVEPPPPPSKFCPELDPAIEAVILRALSKGPENRYPSMHGLADDLERLIGLRTGELYARMPLVRAPDSYQPAKSFGRDAAQFFYRQLGMTPPVWGSRD